jgi:hypothetical protein
MMDTERRWGLWSFAREDWMPDPNYDGPPDKMGPPALYPSFLDAATASMGWHESFRLFPREWPDGMLPTDG